MTTFSIYTFVKYEHDYINQFIEHHINLGINHFYICIDNINYIQKDYKNVINELFNDYVSLYYINDIIDTNISGTHFYLNDYFNKNIIKDIKEDWVLTIGIDSFIYLNGMTMREYINSIDIDIFQIFFPMFLLYNLNNCDTNDFTHNYDNYYTISSSYMYAMAKTKHIKKLNNSTHFYETNNDMQKFIISNNSEIFEIKNDKINMDYLLKNINYDYYDNKIDIFSFHFYLRNYNEIIIKDLLYWSNNIEEKKKSFSKLLEAGEYINYMNNNIDSNRFKQIYYYSKCKKLKKVEKKNFLIKKYNFKNTEIYTENLITNFLKEINISKEKYNYFIEKIKNVILTNINAYENIPDDFNWKAYIELNDDLKNMNEIQAKEHYEVAGYRENRKYKYENIPDDFN
jgi:hypothetical protein